MNATLVGSKVGSYRHYNWCDQDLVGSSFDSTTWGVYHWHTVTHYLLLEVTVDYEKIVSQHGRSFLWTSLMFYFPFQLMLRRVEHNFLENIAGPFDEPAWVAQTVVKEKRKGIIDCQLLPRCQTWICHWKFFIDLYPFERSNFKFLVIFFPYLFVFLLYLVLDNTW